MPYLVTRAVSAEALRNGLLLAAAVLGLLVSFQISSAHRASTRSYDLPAKARFQDTADEALIQAAAITPRRTIPFEMKLRQGIAGSTGRMLVEGHGGNVSFLRSGILQGHLAAAQARKLGYDPAVSAIALR